MSSLRFDGRICREGRRREPKTYASGTRWPLPRFHMISRLIGFPCPFRAFLDFLYQNPGRRSKTSLPRADIFQPFRLKIASTDWFLLFASLRPDAFALVAISLVWFCGNWFSKQIIHNFKTQELRSQEIFGFPVLFHFLHWHKHSLFVFFCRPIYVTLI